MGGLPGCGRVRGPSHVPKHLNPLVVCQIWLAFRVLTRCTLPLRHLTTILMVFYNGWQRSITPSPKSVCVCVRVCVCVCVCMSVYVERVNRLSSSMPLPGAQGTGASAASAGVCGTSTSSSGSRGSSGGVMLCPAVRTKVTRKQTDTHITRAHNIKPTPL